MIRISGLVLYSNNLKKELLGRCERARCSTNVMGSLSGQSGPHYNLQTARFWRGRKVNFSDGLGRACFLPPSFFENRERLLLNPSIKDQSEALQVPLQHQVKSRLFSDGGDDRDKTWKLRLWLLLGIALTSTSVDAKETESSPDDATEAIRQVFQKANQTIFSSRGVQLKSLKDCPEAISHLVDGIFEEWSSYDPSLTKERLSTSIRKGYDSKEVFPITAVAYKNAKYIGTIALKKKTEPEFSDFPSGKLWLGGFRVVPEERNQGLGGDLFKFSAMLAKHLGYQEIYFYTSNPANVKWYVERGAKVIEKRPFRGHTATIMLLPLKPD